MRRSTSLVERVALAAGIKWSKAEREEGLLLQQGHSDTGSHHFFPPGGMQYQITWVQSALTPLVVDTCTPLHMLSVSLQLHFRSPWKAELKLSYSALECWDNAVPVGTEVCFVNRERWDVLTNSCVGTNTQAHAEAPKSLHYTKM